MNWRALFWRLHRWVGLACAAVFLVVALTGTALLIEPQINLKGAVRLDDPATSLAGVETALGRLAVDYPHHQPGLILPGSTSQRSWQVGLRPASGEGSALSAEFDPGSGRVLRVDKAETSLRDVLLKLHNSLFLGVTGKLVVLAMALGVICLTITGVAMMRRRWKALTSSPLAPPLRARSLHHWTGLVGGLFIVLWASTGFMKVMIAAKALHTGLWERSWLHAVYVLFSLTPIAVVVTGPWLWLRRRRPARNKAERSTRRIPSA